MSIALHDKLEHYSVKFMLHSNCKKILNKKSEKLSTLFPQLWMCLHRYFELIQAIWKKMQSRPVHTIQLIRSSLQSNKEMLIKHKSIG